MLRTRQGRPELNRLLSQWPRSGLRIIRTRKLLVAFPVSCASLVAMSTTSFVAATYAHLKATVHPTEIGSTSPKHCRNAYAFIHQLSRGWLSRYCSFNRIGSLLQRFSSSLVCPDQMHVISRCNVTNQNWQHCCLLRMTTGFKV